jgi:orotidine-5'-phosphate decarboxylase
MSERNFREMLEAQWSRGNFVCVGLDSEYEKIPPAIRSECGIADSITGFNRSIIEKTSDLVCAYKSNMAFYGANGTEGLMALRATVGLIHDIAPGVPVILDGKRGDIGNTNNGYVREAFEYLQADAVTVPPYMGRESLKPFLDCKDKGVIVLCRTSNPGAGEFQDLEVPIDDEEGRFLSEAHVRFGWNLMGYRTALFNHVAYRVSKHWNNENGNCALVVGATYPAELREVRKIVGDMPILIPGIGAQGGDVEKTVSAGKDSHGKGMIINSSRGIIFAEDPRLETIKLRDLINQYREGAK